jgi:hypothetical protein
MGQKLQKLKIMSNVDCAYLFIYLFTMRYLAYTWNRKVVNGTMIIKHELVRLQKKVMRFCT